MDQSLLWQANSLTCVEGFDRSKAVDFFEGNLKPHPNRIQVIESYVDLGPLE
jgi:hypothetical protein